MMLFDDVVVVKLVGYRQFDGFVDRRFDVQRRAIAPVVQVTPTCNVYCNQRVYLQLFDGDFASWKLRLLSLTVRVYHSISGTCSSLDTVFKAMPSHNRSARLRAYAQRRTLCFGIRL